MNTCSYVLFCKVKTNLNIEQTYNIGGDIDLLSAVILMHNYSLHQFKLKLKQPK